jgi:hypothetical protein
MYLIAILLSLPHAQPLHHFPIELWLQEAEQGRTDDAAADRQSAAELGEWGQELQGGVLCVPGTIDDDECVDSGDDDECEWSDDDRALLGVWIR